MYCEKCGATLAAGATFCENCGTPVAKKPEAKSNSKLKLIIAAVVAVALIWALVSLVFSPSYKDVAKKYVVASLKYELTNASKYTVYGDLAKYLDKYAKEEDEDIDDFYDMVEEQCDVDNIKNTKSAVKALEKYAKEQAEEKYGKYSVKVTLDDIEKLDKDDLKDLKKSWDDEDDDLFDADKITAAYEVEVEWEINGKDEDDDGKMTVKVVKYKGSWKVLNIPMNF